MNKDQTIIDSILEFWMKDSDSNIESATQQAAIWFNATDDLDQYLKKNFTTWLDQAESGKLDHWQVTSDASLALILLLDQFSRNMYRGTTEAFKFDAKALNISLSMQLNGQLEELGCIGKVFALMPMQHSEDISIQEASVIAFNSVAENSPAGYEALLKGNAEFAVLHRDIIHEFARFPHRNRILGRTNTTAEKNWLNQGAPTFGQG
ncbi:MAG: hypothetical protein ACI8P9_004831 [Parasphingorhabdus sp.]|jgi:uncharacterized protein (DUF924 family)